MKGAGKTASTLTASSLRPHSLYKHDTSLTDNLASDSAERPFFAEMTTLCNS